MQTHPDSWRSVIETPDAHANFTAARTGALRAGGRCKSPSLVASTQSSDKEANASSVGLWLCSSSSLESHVGGLSCAPTPATLSPAPSPLTGPEREQCRPRRTPRRLTQPAATPRAARSATAPRPSSTQRVPSPTSAPLDKAVQRRIARPPILPKQPVDKEYHIPPSPESDSASEEEDEYEPGREAAPAPKRRGRKPGSMSRSARESLRKLNHSKIEKARRTKINETLATLSMLVNDRERVLPSAGKAGAEAEAEKTEETKGKKGKKTEEKEFKLDVLVKTVEFMQGLIDRIKTLESATCAQCRTAHRPRPTMAEHSQQPKETLKRKRTDDADESQRTAKHKRPPTRQEEDDSYIGDDEQGLGNAGRRRAAIASPLARFLACRSSSCRSSSCSLPLLCLRPRELSLD
ncbi:hypothetical protein ONZ51_g6989 [Trametes cubensis]|uniref:BHLH domain-containing protein n=1 Tax=Trametes cubensis TaxID=1111947 RepID=A0AAD7XA12_9APHY|nr:hypothetical protein ONZ51_g6989 [Trametes cubensis]